MPAAVVVEALLQGFMAAHEQEQQQQEQEQQQQQQQQQQAAQQASTVGDEQPGGGKLSWRLALLRVLGSHPHLHAPLLSRLAQLLLQHGPDLGLQQVRPRRV
jgi:hypothetical protein